MRARSPASRFLSLTFFLSATALTAVTLAAQPQVAGGHTLWKIGVKDGSASEFALAPGNYTGFRDDGFFVVGRSDPKRDWPYVQPGPGDGWAGGRGHTFSVVFGVKAQPSGGREPARWRLPWWIPIPAHRQN